MCRWLWTLEQLAVSKFQLYGGANLAIERQGSQFSFSSSLSIFGRFQTTNILGCTSYAFAFAFGVCDAFFVIGSQGVSPPPRPILPQVCELSRCREVERRVDHTIAAERKMQSPSRPINGRPYTSYAAVTTFPSIATPASGWQTARFVNLVGLCLCDRVVARKNLESAFRPVPQRC
jgi:hypothetical protein